MRQAVIESLRKQIGRGVKSLVKNRQYKRYLRTEGENRLEIDEKAIEEESRCDGKWVLKTNLPSGFRGRAGLQEPVAGGASLQGDEVQPETATHVPLDETACEGSHHGLLPGHGARVCASALAEGFGR